MDMLMEREQKIGFFGGTFDPIHFGHIHLAVQLSEIHHLDRVLLCPANFSPHKSHDMPHMDRQHRLRMVQLAIEDIGTFAVSDSEIKRSGPSYTIDTVRHLIDEHSRSKEKIAWHLLLGEDSLKEFHRWKESEELVRLAPPLIGTRMLITDWDLDFPPALLKALKEGITKIPLMEMSSTVIRERLAKKRYCGHLVPAKVLDYIHQNRLYSTL